MELVFNAKVNSYSNFKGDIFNSNINIHSNKGNVFNSNINIGSLQEKSFNSIMNIESSHGVEKSNTFNSAISIYSSLKGRYFNSVVDIRKGLYLVLPVELNIFEQLFVSAQVNATSLSDTTELPFSKIGEI